jgi:type II secretory ATPase GspE/PulE/Tfp pilus assembly ATPase PilB-like protein
MGVEPYLVASSLIGAVAQRLVRKNCAFCIEVDEPDRELLRAMGISKSDYAGTTPFRRGRGCDKCQHTGYKGRVGLYELFIIDEHIRRMTVDRASSNDMKDLAIKNQGMRTLLGDGVLAVLAGKTTPEEVMRVCARESF